MTHKGIVFDELPEELQARLAEKNPELRAYRLGHRDPSQDKLEVSLARLEEARTVLHQKRQHRLGTPLWLRLVGVALTAIVIFNAAGGK